MGNSSSAGAAKRGKNMLGNLLTNIGNVGKSFTDSKVLTVVPGLKMLGTPINTALGKVSTTVQNTGQLTKGNITSDQYKKYLNNEYKYSGLLGPINAYRTMRDSPNGARQVVKDFWNYNKEFIPIIGSL